MIQAAEMKMRSAKEERINHRLRLSRLLSTADWQPPGMSPTAVLIVRHLSDPLPGQLTAQPAALRAPRAWETAVKQQMTTLYHRAARPYRGQLPLVADAVLFADEAEMLACLALDVARGQAADRWWWQALRRARPALSIHETVTLLQTEPRLIPAIFSCLHQWGAAAVVTAALSTDQAMVLHTAVTDAFHLPPLPTSQSAGLPAAPDPTSVPVPPPWESFLPPTAVSTPLPWPHACLLGISLSLVRRPTAVSTTSFQRQLQRWWQAQSRLLMDPASHSLEPGTPVSAPGHAAPAPPLSVASKTMVAEKRPLPSLSTVQPPKPPREDTTAPAETATSSPLETAVPDSSYQLTTPDAADTAAFPDDGIPTQLGGVLYLINLMVQLDIPACYEESWGLASQVGAWGALELLARSLLEPMPKPLQDDPIWAVLAELDGRSPNEPLLTKSYPRLTFPLPDIRAHLLALLRLDDPNRLVETLLLVNARLNVTHTHVDLVMPLEAVSIPVRLAGLDFDPGWQPAFGRVIQFHFR